MEIRVTKNFTDKMTGAHCEKGDMRTVDDERGAEIISKGYAAAVEPPTEPPADETKTKKKSSKKTE